MEIWKHKECHWNLKTPNLVNDGIFGVKNLGTWTINLLFLQWIYYAGLKSTSGVTSMKDKNRNSILLRAHTYILRSAGWIRPWWLESTIQVSVKKWMTHYYEYSGMKTDFCKKIWKVRRAVTRATFAREAPRNPWIFHIWGLNNHPISVKHKPKT